MGPLETFGSKVVVGWRFRFRYMGIFGRRRIDRPQEVSSKTYVEMNTLTSRIKLVSLPPPYLYRNDFSQSNIQNSPWNCCVLIKSNLNHTEIWYDGEITVIVLSHPVPNTHVVGIYQSKTGRILR